MVRQISWADERTWIGTKVTDHSFVPEELLETALGPLSRGVRRPARRVRGGGGRCHGRGDRGAGARARAGHRVRADRRARRDAGARRAAPADSAGEHRPAGAQRIRPTDDDPANATGIVAETLRADAVGVLEVTAGGELAVAGLVGLDLPTTFCFRARTRSQLSAGLAADEPVIIRGPAHGAAVRTRRATHRRRAGQRDHGAGPRQRRALRHPRRLLARSAPLHRDESKFLQAVATVLASAFARHRELKRTGTRRCTTASPACRTGCCALERLGRPGTAPAPGDARPAVFVLDVDRFKVVNDSLGHDAGRRAAASTRRCASAKRVRPATPWRGSAATSSPVAAARTSPTLPRRSAWPSASLASLARAVQVAAGRALSTSASASRPPTRAERPEDLLRDADAAMYRAKGRAATATRSSTRACARSGWERLRVESELRRAIERGELRVHYQPIVDLDSGRPSAPRRWCAGSTLSAVCCPRPSSSGSRRRPA